MTNPTNLEIVLKSLNAEQASATRNVNVILELFTLANSLGAGLKMHNYARPFKGVERVWNSKAE